VLDYEEEVPPPISREYELHARDFSRTGSPSLPAGLNLGRQLFWQAGRFPEEFAAVTDVLLYPQYWAFRLGGAKASEVTSLGCHTDLWEPVERRFSAFVRACGWERLFPKVVPAWQSVGGPSDEVQEAGGLAPDCRILAGIHDSNASFLAHRAHREGPFTVVSTGTWIVCLACEAPLENLRAELDMLANVDAFGDPVPSARFMGGREYAVIAGASGLHLDPGAADALAVVKSGALALPGFAVEGGPFRTRTGRLVEAESLGERQRAALAAVYCALVTDHCLGLLGARGDIVVEGRFARNEAYCATLAGLRPQQRVGVAGDETGTVVGAAILTGLPGEPRGLEPSVAHASPLPPGPLAAYRRRWLDRSEAIVCD
jgi:sugar (pentulose or hexulose) kinase